MPRPNLRRLIRARHGLAPTIQPEVAKRKVVQTGTLNTGESIMTINKLHANESEQAKHPG